LEGSRVSGTGLPMGFLLAARNGLRPIQEKLITP
jgi:hypothetical protein